MSFKNKKFILAVFDDETQMVNAAKALREREISIFDFYTPFPVHGIDDLLEIKRTRLPIVCFIAGSIGFILSIWFQIWTSQTDWPINVGGKPFNSFPAFIPVSFEITILLGALVTVAAFFIRSKLYPSAKPSLADLRQTDDKFVLAVEEIDATLDLSKVEEIFRSQNAIEVRSSGGYEW